MLSLSLPPFSFSSFLLSHSLSLMIYIGNSRKNEHPCSRFLYLSYVDSLPSLSSIKLGSTLYILSLSLALVFFLFINAAVTSLLSFSSVLFALVPSFPARAYEDFFCAHTRGLLRMLIARVAAGWHRGGGRYICMKGNIVK